MIETVDKVRCKGHTYFCVPQGANIITAHRKSDLPKGYPIRVARWWSKRPGVGMDHVYEWHWSLSTVAYPNLYEKITVVEAAA